MTFTIESKILELMYDLEGTYAHIADELKRVVRKELEKGDTDIVVIESFTKKRYPVKTIKKYIEVLNTLGFHEVD